MSSIDLTTVCSIGVHSTFWYNAATAIGIYVNIKSGNVNIVLIFIHVEAGIFFHSLTVVTAPNKKSIQ